MNINEKQLIKRCQNGDKAAFNELIRAFYPYVTKYLLKLTASEDIAEDLTQEVFLRIIRTIDSFDINGRASFGTYIITTAKNLYIDRLRRNRITVDSLNDLEITSGEDIEQKVITSLEFSEVMKYLDGLPPNQAQAIRLKYIDEFTLKEIEGMTGIPAKTIKSRIHEGTKKLRNLLKRGKCDYGKG